MSRTPINVYILAPNSWQGSDEACIRATAVTQDADLSPCHAPGMLPISAARVLIDLEANPGADSVVFELKACNAWDGHTVPANQQTKFAATEGIFLKSNPAVVTKDGQPATPPPALENWIQRLEGSVPQRDSDTQYSVTIPNPPQLGDKYLVHLWFGITYVAHQVAGGTVQAHTVKVDPEMDFEPPS